MEGVIHPVLKDVRKFTRKLTIQDRQGRIVGFGNFQVAQRKASTGRNPRTGAAVQIPASRVPKFRAGKALKEAVNA